MAITRALLPVFLVSILYQPVFAAEIGRLGVIRFPASASGGAQEHFLAGIAYLHSFGFKQARAEFIRAQELDPDFVLAYWGESLSYNHPFYPESNPEASVKALEKLGLSSLERQSKAQSGLERGLLAAAETLFLANDSLHNRRRAYRRTMETLYGNYPAHEEVQAFYILALLSEAASSEIEQRDRLRELAGLLSSRLFSQNNSHPGAAHYVIHSYDDPQDADNALEAADRFADIAPLIPHARHMPSHIYGHFGRWYEVADLNETAFYTARALWQRGDDPVDQIHTLDYGQYGDLQLANVQAAVQWIERAEDTLTQNPGHQQTIQLLGRMRARMLIETKQWVYHPIDNSLTSEELLAYGLSATNMRDLPLARQANALLKDRSLKEPDSISLRIAQWELEASILFTAGQIEDSLTTIDQAAELALQYRNIAPLPDPIKPALELKGELLLRAGHPELAIEAFQSALEITPQRPWSLLGLARSHVASGATGQASTYYLQLLDHWTDTDLLGVSEARTHLVLYGEGD